MNEIISFQNVSKTYEGESHAALQHVSLSVQQGEFVCFIGASGCGKSTVLKLMAGLEQPTEGVIEKPERVALSFQFAALFPWLTVYENVALGLRESNMTDEMINRMVQRELRAMHIHELAQKYPADLSGGQRQRVGIARALAVDPHVLLLDEPFSALDAKTTAELHDDLIALWRSTKKTIVLVSHLIEEAVSLSDRVILMKEGSIVHEYPVDLPYPRRENQGYHDEVMKIRRDFFK